MRRNSFFAIACVFVFSAFLFMGCVPAKRRTAVIKANGGKPGSQKVGPGGTTSTSFTQFVHATQPDELGMYDYLANTEPTSLKAVTTGQNRFYEAAVILKLNSDHTYNLFYEEYLAQKDTHGNECSQIEDGEVKSVRPHIFNVEKTGQWKETNGQLSLDTLATGSITTSGDDQTITLNFKSDLDPAHGGLLQGQSDSVEPVQYTLSSTDLTSELGTDVMTEDNANAELDKACGKASALTPAPAAAAAPATESKITTTTKTTTTTGAAKSATLHSSSARH